MAFVEPTSYSWVKGRSHPVATAPVPNLSTHISLFAPAALIAGETPALPALALNSCPHRNVSATV